MFVKSVIDIGTESFTDEQTCAVNLKVTVNCCTVTDIIDTDEGELQVIYDVIGHTARSIPTFSFSFDELSNFPLKCKDRFEKQVSTVKLDPTTGQDLVDKMLKHAVFLAYLRRVEGYIDSGYKFEATLEILLFIASDVQIGTYVAGDGEEVITCSLCLENLNAGVVFSELPCDHIFHNSCLNPWLESNRTCPNCRFRIRDVNVSDEFLEDLSRLNASFIRIPST